jgi:hypothetical protein
MPIKEKILAKEVDYFNGVLQGQIHSLTDILSALQNGDLDRDALSENLRDVEQGFRKMKWLCHKN